MYIKKMCVALLCLSSVTTIHGQTAASVLTPASPAPMSPTVLLTTPQPTSSDFQAPTYPSGVPVPEFISDPETDGMKVRRAVESYSDLSLKGSELRAIPPLLGTREIHKTYIRELYQVMWRANDPIDLYVIRPVGVKRPPVILFLYGFPTETDRFKDDSWCQRVVQGGAAAVGFVSALTGQRYNYRPRTEDFISQLPESLTTTVHDVPFILDYLNTRGDLDMSRVGMFGQGSGGAIAVLATSIEPRIKVLDLLDPWGSWAEWFVESPLIQPQDRAKYSAPEFLKPLATLDPVAYLPDLKTRNIRIQWIDDEGDGKEVIAMMTAAAPLNTKVVRYATGRAMYEANSNGKLFTWISKELCAVPASVEPLTPVAIKNAHGTAQAAKR